LCHRGGSGYRQHNGRYRKNHDSLHCVPSLNNFAVTNSCESEAMARD
jgi:hypothetical protein